MLGKIGLSLFVLSLVIGCGGVDPESKETKNSAVTVFENAPTIPLKNAARNFLSETSVTYADEAFAEKKHKQVNDELMAATSALASEAPQGAYRTAASQCHLEAQTCDRESDSDEKLECAAALMVCLDEKVLPLAGGN
jgi:hypothetical protein